MPTISERQKDATKQGIYEAAVEVLTHDGLDRATMSRVAQQAGISKGSLYNYFKDKDHLLEFVFEKTIDPLHEQIMGIVDSNAPVLEKLHGVFVTLLNYLGERRKLFSFLLSQQALQKYITPSCSQGPATFALLIQQGIDDGVFRPCDTNFHATMVYGMLRAISDDYLDAEEPLEVDHIAQQLSQFCAIGFAVSPEKVT
ncbi:TetR/AcrR family transcriptional regulator [Aeoliella mucimassa]|uniref:HTH-type transcriptional repressor KstR2 n=1 Tax=Aeoliella mucimassa TaxID=2527972 RepID=A0A518AR89_9BACT|nr:TetR/AcrR family transcriptional regulator [Aeoliella mucimassa]QDU57249.1 HTH-type transcriptional repressor KstR2 [Aeoliella mucimassa]